MQDSVAEVLLERQSVGGPNRAGLLISVAVHAAAFLLFIAAPHTRQTPERARVITMRLAPSGGAPRTADTGGQRRSQPAQTPAPAVKPVEARPVSTPVPQERVLQRPIRTDPARTGEKSVFGTQGKPAPAATARPAPAAPAAGPPSSGVGGAEGSGGFAVPGVGTAGVTGLEGGDFPYNVYIDRMTTRIGEQWARPRVESEFITRVYFIIERDGRIRDAKIEESSGNGSFDRAALRAVIQASPLPPLPGQYSGRYLGVHLTFH